MANQWTIQDDNQFPALIGHSGTAGTAETRRAVVENGHLLTTFGLSSSTDAFGRLRVSDPVTSFDSQNQYDMSPLQWENIFSGSGTATHLPNESAVQMSTGGTASGAASYRQTRQYFRYQPGKSQLILMTAVVGTAKANVRQRWGYFDSQNGLFFEQTSSGMSVVRRTFTSGTAVDNVVTQANWNQDKFDGTGKSGFNLDVSKAQIWWIDFEALYVGVVRMGVYNEEGLPISCHHFKNANALTTPYLTTANLPVRLEIENTAGASSLTTMKQICCSVISEGGFESDRGLYQSANNGTTVVATTNRRSILSIRPMGSFNGITNRALIDNLSYNILVQTGGAANVFYEILYNPTFSGTPTWTAVGTATSAMEYSVHGDAANGTVSGGIVVDSGYIEVAAKATGLVNREASSRLPLVINSAGTSPISLSIVSTSMGASTNLTASLTWKEIK